MRGEYFRALRQLMKSIAAAPVQYTGMSRLMIHWRTWGLEISRKGRVVASTASNINKIIEAVLKCGATCRPNGIFSDLIQRTGCRLLEVFITCYFIRLL